MGIDPESIENTDTTTPSLGQQLRAGRERLALSVPDVSARLKLSQRIVTSMEEDKVGASDDGVFLRGYLLSYARLVGLPADVIHDVVRDFTRPVPLIATGTTPKSRYLLDRWSVSATYLILTGLIVGPTVWLAMTHGSIEHQLVDTTPLDRAGQVVVADSAQDRTGRDASGELTSAEASSTMVLTSTPSAVESTEPVKASLAPFSGMSTVETANPPVVMAANRVVLSTSEPCWVEVLKPDGSRVEYGVLPAGTERSYDGDTALTIRIGNVAGTRLVVDGDTVDLATLSRGNVAHLRLFGDETTVARVEP
ncbi:MAG: RodZ domain-containing protein [Dokdonella sp.]